MAMVMEQVPFVSHPSVQIPLQMTMAMQLVPIPQTLVSQMQTPILKTMAMHLAMAMQQVPVPQTLASRISRPSI